MTRTGWRRAIGARVVILGAGTAGTIVANRLRRRLPDSDEITVVDQNTAHLYQPGLLFVPFGGASARLQRPARAQLHSGINYLHARIDRVDTSTCTVHLRPKGDNCPPAVSYDALVVATGAQLAPDETDGLDFGTSANVHTFYTLDGARSLASALAGFDRGRIVVGVIDVPIKCPVAPLEFCFLADAYFRRRGVRDQVTLTYVTPLDAPFTRPVASRALTGLLARKHIEVVTDFGTGEVNPDRGVLTSFDARTVPFDLAVLVPVHTGAEFVARSPELADPMGFVPVDPHTLQSRIDPHVFAAGDAAALAASKAGSVAHFEGEVLAENVAQFLDGETPTAHFDGHTNCFVETGQGKALLIDFNDETEPLPGRYPGRFGLPLLRESRLNHWGKRLFEPLYWHVLLPGRGLPGIGPIMPVRGKQYSAAADASSGVQAPVSTR